MKKTPHFKQGDLGNTVGDRETKCLTDSGTGSKEKYGTLNTLNLRRQSNEVFPSFSVVKKSEEAF